MAMFNSFLLVYRRVKPSTKIRVHNLPMGPPKGDPWDPVGTPLGPRWDPVGTPLGPLTPSHSRSRRMHKKCSHLDLKPTIRNVSDMAQLAVESHKVLKVL